MGNAISLHRILNNNDILNNSNDERKMMTFLLLVYINSFKDIAIAIKKIQDLTCTYLVMFKRVNNVYLYKMKLVLVFVTKHVPEFKIGESVPPVFLITSDCCMSFPCHK